MIIRKIQNIDNFWVDPVSGYQGGSATEGQLIAETATAFRKNIFTPQYEYLLKSIKDQLKRKNLAEHDANTVLSKLALSLTSFVSTDNLVDTPIAIPSLDELKEIETYFKSSSVDLLEIPLATSTTQSAAEIMIDLHVLISLLTDEETIRFSLENPSLMRQEQALRLLLQSLQMMDILRAQHGIIDGRTLLPFLYEDLFDGTQEDWNIATKILENNSFVRTNFTRYLVLRRLAEAKLPKQAYGTILSSCKPSAPYGQISLIF